MYKNVVIFTHILSTPTLCLMNCGICLHYFQEQLAAGLSLVRRPLLLCAPSNQTKVCAKGSGIQGVGDKLLWFIKAAIFPIPRHSHTVLTVRRWCSKDVSQQQHLLWATGMSLVPTPVLSGTLPSNPTRFYMVFQHIIALSQLAGDFRVPALCPSIHIKVTLLLILKRISFLLFSDSFLPSHCAITMAFPKAGSSSACSQRDCLSWIPPHCRENTHT